MAEYIHLRREILDRNRHPANGTLMSFGGVHPLMEGSTRYRNRHPANRTLMSFGRVHPPLNMEGRARQEQARYKWNVDIFRQSTPTSKYGWKREKRAGTKQLEEQFPLILHVGLMADRHGFPQVPVVNTEQVSNTCGKHGTSLKHLW